MRRQRRLLHRRHVPYMMGCYNGEMGVTNGPDRNRIVTHDAYVETPACELRAGDGHGPGRVGLAA